VILPAPPKRVYLAGAIEHAPDGGREWRDLMSQFLVQALGFDVFNPCVEEHSLLKPDEKHNFRTWKKSDPERFRRIVRRFVDNDLAHLTRDTLFVVCLWDEYANRGAGTAGELTVAYLLRIPIYLVQGCPMDSIPGWILACASEILPDFSSLQDFLRRRYPRHEEASTAQASESGA
jgi:hypothetical protein